MKIHHTGLILVAAIAGALPAAALADMAYNVGVTSDYRYRGISQSRLKPALQGGADYTAGAFYLGTWASSINWIKDAGTLTSVNTGSTGVEIDVYAGMKGEFSKGSVRVR